MNTPTGTGKRLYACNGLRVRVNAPGERLEWLDEFLLPWFAATGTAPPAREITLCEDNAQWEALAAKRTTTEGEAASAHGFTLDGPPALLQVLGPVAGGPCYFDEQLEVFYVPRSGSVQVVGRRDGRENGFAVVRLVRELIMERCFAAGTPVLHAAAVASGGRGALLLGAKGAGKTTLSMNCVTRLGFRFVANDRAIVLREGGGQPQVHGIPTLVRVRNTTRPLLVDLPWHRFERRYLSRETLAKALATPAAGSAHLSDLALQGAKFLSPAQHCWLMGAAPLVSARLAVILLPETTGQRQGLRVQRLSPAETATALTAACFNEGAKNSEKRVFAEADGVSAAETAIADLAQRLPAYRCSLGRGALEDATTLPGLLQAAQ